MGEVVGENTLNNLIDFCVYPQTVLHRRLFESMSLNKVIDIAYVLGGHT